VVDDTMKFYKLVARVGLAKLNNQLISRYIGGMRQQFHGALNFFDPLNVSNAYKRALHLENTLSRRPLGLVGGSNGGNNRPNPTPPIHGAVPPSM